MPRTRRQDVKRKMEYNIKNLKEQGSKMLMLAEIYEQHHPEISAALLNLAELVIIVVGEYETIAEEI